MNRHPENDGFFVQCADVTSSHPATSPPMSLCVPRRLTKTRGLAPNVTFGGRMTFPGSPGAREYHRTRNGPRKSERRTGEEPERWLKPPPRRRRRVLGTG